MTKKFFATIASSVAAYSMMAAPQIDIVDPPYWWTGMENDTLQIMLHGDDIRDCHINVDYPGVKLLDVARLDNPNYQLLYLLVTDEAPPGTINITLNDLKLRRNSQAVIPYELRQRDANAHNIKGFDASDVLYLIMPDRFADGNPDNNR